MAIAFVNNGTGYGNAATTSALPGLPASIVAGNLLLALCAVRTTATVAVSSGWTVGDTKSQLDTGSVNWKFIWAWRVATGSDTAPTFSWTGGTFAAAYVLQLSGTLGVPFSGVSSNSTGTGTPHTSASITATGGGDAMYVDMSSVSTALTTPSGWSSIFSNVSQGTSFNVGLKTFSGTGDTSGAISTAGSSSTAWSEWQLELAAPVNFAYTGTGGMSMGGTAPVFPSSAVVGTGGMSMGGAAAISWRTAVLIDYVGSGGMSMGGGADITDYLEDIGALAAVAPAGVPSLTGSIGNVATLAAVAPVPRASLVGGTQQLAATAPVAQACLTGVLGVPASITVIAPVGVAALTGSIGLVATLGAAAPLGIAILTGAQTLQGTLAAIAPHPTASLGGAASIVGVLAACAPVAIADASGSLGLVAALSAIAPTGRTHLIADIEYGAVVGVVVTQTQFGFTSEYESFSYDSFGKIGSAVYAAGSDGIYELDSAGTDNGAQIDAYFQFGNLDFSSEYLKRLESLYMAYRTSGDLNVVVHTDEGKSYTYVMKYDGVQTIKQRRVPIGKGLKGKYWQLRVENVKGSSFGIDTFNVLAHETVRRVGV